MTQVAIKNGIQSYLTPALVGIVAWFANDKLTSIEKRLEGFEEKFEKVNKIEGKLDVFEKTFIFQLNRTPAKKEEIFSLK